MAASGVLTHDYPSIVCLLLQGGNGLGPRLNYMYIEYENVASAEEVVDYPTQEELEENPEGIEYYEDLANVAGRDYLRVPISSVLISSTDEETYPQGNQFTITARTEGAEGRHETPFSASAISKICGAAAVVARDPDDPTQDLVLARWYLDASKQVVKLENVALSVTKTVTLG